MKKIARPYREKPLPSRQADSLYIQIMLLLEQMIDSNDTVFKYNKNADELRFNGVFNKCFLNAAV